MRMLKLRAIHLDHRARISKQDLGRRFHNPRLAGTCRPKKQQIPQAAPANSIRRKTPDTNPPAPAHPLPARLSSTEETPETPSFARYAFPDRGKVSLCS